MATYSTIELNIDRLRQVILEEGDKAMQLAIESNFGVFDYFGGVETEHDLISVNYKAKFDDIRAWVMFFGRGQGLTHDNPFFDEYTTSKFWADGRPRSGAVVRRGSKGYDQYDYNTGELKHYDSGTEPQGEVLPSWQQALLRINPEIDFWSVIRVTYRTFISNFTNIAIPNINRRYYECFVIKQHTV